MKKVGSIVVFMRRWFIAALLAAFAICTAIFGGMMIAAGLHRIWGGIVQFLRDTGSPLATGATAPGALNSSGTLDVLLVVAGIVFIWFGIWIVKVAASRSGEATTATIATPRPVMAGGRIEDADAFLRTRFHPFESDAEALKAWNDAVALERQGRHATAATILRRLAEDHFEDAALALATVLEDGGPDLTPDPVEARRWYEIALAEADQRGRTSMLFGGFLLAEAEKTGGDVGLVDRQRGIALLWQAVESGAHDAFATLALCHLWQSKLAAPDLNEAERIAGESRRRGLLLGDFIEARVLRARGRRVMAVVRHLSSVRRVRAIARRDRDDPRIVGVRWFLTAVSGSEMSEVVDRMLGLAPRDKQEV